MCDDLSVIKSKVDFDKYGFEISYDKMLGKGGFGAVYPVLDPDGYTVAAVKQIQRSKHFAQEVKISFFFSFDSLLISIL